MNDDRTAETRRSRPRSASGSRPTASPCSARRRAAPAPPNFALCAFALSSSVEVSWYAFSASQVRLRSGLLRAPPPTPSPLGRRRRLLGHERVGLGGLFTPPRVLRRVLRRDPGRLRLPRPRARRCQGRRPSAARRSRKQPPRFTASTIASQARGSAPRHIERLLRLRRRRLRGVERCLRLRDREPRGHRDRAGLKRFASRAFAVAHGRLGAHHAAARLVERRLGSRVATGSSASICSMRRVDARPGPCLAFTITRSRFGAADPSGAASRPRSSSPPLAAVRRDHQRARQVLGVLPLRLRVATLLHGGRVRRETAWVRESRRDLDPGRARSARRSPSAAAIVAWSNFAPVSAARQGEASVRLHREERRLVSAARSASTLHSERAWIAAGDFLRGRLRSHRPTTLRPFAVTSTRHAALVADHDLDGRLLRARPDKVGEHFATHGVVAGERAGWRRRATTSRRRCCRRGS